MNLLSKMLLGSVAGAFLFGLGTLGLTSVVQYKPWGVPEHRRQEYDQKIARLEELAAEAKSSAVQATAKVLSGRVHDFGFLNPHETATHSFRIENSGTGPLQLEVADSTCKCTVGTLKSRFVQPGETTDVTLTWNTGFQADDYEQSVLLRTNDERNKSIKLTVKGTVRAELVLPTELAFTKSDFNEHALGEFIVYSQLWDDFEISSINSDLRDFNWVAEPLPPSSVELGDADAKTAWKVQVWTFRDSYGEFSGELDIEITPPGATAPIQRKVTAKGKVRGAISFQSPDIHKTQGLDIGTVVSGEQREFFVTVRSRSKQSRSLKVLDVEPKELQVDLTKNRTAGSYRLSIVVPKDCPRVIFSADHKHGYVQVGDPDDKNYSNWFPLRGAVAVIND